MEKQTLTVPNISCGHCVMTIKNEINALEGIHSVEGDPQAKTISIEWDTPTTIDKIRELLKEINYPAQ